MRVKLRDRLRDWLGIASDSRLVTFELCAQKRQTELREMLNNLELRSKQRHDALMGMLNRVEQRLINAHAFDKPSFAPAQLDWDTVQAIALQQLRENPEKEN